MLMALLSLLITSARCVDITTPILEFFGIYSYRKLQEEAKAADNYRPYPGATWCDTESRVYRFDGRPLPSRHNHTFYKAFQSFCRKHHFYGKNHVQEDCYGFANPPDLLGDRLLLRVEYKNADYLAPDKCLKELRMIHHTCFYGGKGLGLDHVEYEINPRRGFCDPKFTGFDEDIPKADHVTFGDVHEPPGVQAREFHA